MPDKDVMRSAELRHGGLMRCCTETWYDMLMRGDLDRMKKGDTIVCAYANEDQQKLHTMRLANDGVWEWARSDEGGET